MATTSSSSGTTNINGSLIDGYIRDATGELIDLSDGSVVTTFTTNSVGYWSIDISNSDIPDVYKINFLPGGVDIGTGKTISSSFSSVSTKSQISNLSAFSINVTPITTVKSKIVETNYASQPSNISSIITNADTKVAEAFGITRYDIDKDFISSQDPVVLKASTKINLVVESLKINIAQQDSNVTGDDIIIAVASSIENGSGVYDFTDSANVTNIVNNSTSVTLSATTITNSITISSKASTKVDAATGNFDAIASDVIKTTVATIDTVTTTDKTVVIDSTNYETAITNEKDNVSVGQIYNDQVSEPADDTVPVITLTGNASVTVAFGSTYNDAGATASDNKDGDITANITTVNPVNTSVAETYTITYNVSDAAGNAAGQVTRTVIVEAAAVVENSIEIVISVPDLEGSGVATSTLKVGFDIENVLAAPDPPETYYNPKFTGYKLSTTGSNNQATKQPLSVNNAISPSLAIYNLGSTPDTHLHGLKIPVGGDAWRNYQSCTITISNSDLNKLDRCTLHNGTSNSVVAPTYHDFLTDGSVASTIGESYTTYTYTAGDVTNDYTGFSTQGTAWNHAVETYVWVVQFKAV